MWQFARSAVSAYENTPSAHSTLHAGAHHPTIPICCPCTEQGHTDGVPPNFYSTGLQAKDRTSPVFSFF